MSNTAFIDHLDSVLPRRLTELKLPGAAVALIESGEPAAVRCYGWADVERQIPVSDSTVFRLASISKSLAAWAVMKLVQTRQVKLDQPIGRYLKQWQLPASPFDNDGVTIRRLLSHRAGISTAGVGRTAHTGAPISVLDGLEGRQPPLDAAQERYYKRWSLPPDARATVDQAPGSAFAYANCGFAMLELMVAEVSGRPYADFVRDEITGPLGMRHAGFDPLSADMQSAFATGYGEDGRAIEDLVPLSMAAAGLCASITDLASFACAGMAGPHAAMLGRGVLNPGSIKQMYESEGAADMDTDTCIAFEAGLGNFLCQFGGQLHVHHSGGFHGWRSIYWIVPETGDGLCMLINSDAGNPLWQKLLQEWAPTVSAPG